MRCNSQRSRPLGRRVGGEGHACHTKRCHVTRGAIDCLDWDVDLPTHCLIRLSITGHVERIRSVLNALSSSASHLYTKPLTHMRAASLQDRTISIEKGNFQNPEDINFTSFQLVEPTSLQTGGCRIGIRSFNRKNVFDDILPLLSPPVIHRSPRSTLTNAISPPTQQTRSPHRHRLRGEPRSPHRPLLLAQ